eukprot:gene14569-14698_t
MMCFQGYTGRLCSNCIFPGTSPETAYGQYYSGCGLCPPWSTAMTAYVLSRVFDIAIYTRSKAGGSRRVINYSPASLTTGELFEVFKDFLQVLSILQVVLHGWQSAAAAAMSSLSITPLSTKAWISLDCILPRTQAVAVQRQMYNIAAQRRFKAPIISSLLVLLSYFYPSLAFTVLSVFSCRYLDPDLGGGRPGPSLGRCWRPRAGSGLRTSAASASATRATGPLPWVWGSQERCCCWPTPLLQGVILARQAAAGQLQPTSEFFASYGHLVEDFRPRLFYWGSIVELRKLVLVAVVLGLASTGVISQLLGCSLVLLAFCSANMGLLPYPYRLLNRLHLGSAGVLLAVVWLNLFVAVGEEGGVLSGGISGKHSVVLQLISVALVVVMIGVLVYLCAVRGYRKMVEIFDVDGDGKISWSDIRAFMHKLQGKHNRGLIGRVLGGLVGDGRRDTAVLVSASWSDIRATSGEHQANIRA